MKRSTLNIYIHTQSIIKWCTEFILLGIHLDVALSRMQVNYEKAVEAVRRELRTWKHRLLTIFGKIKTMCLLKLNHIITGVPHPNLSYLQQLDAKFKGFIFYNNQNVVDKTTRLMTKQQGGLGIL